MLLLARTTASLNIIVTPQTDAANSSAGATPTANSGDRGCLSIGSWTTFPKLPT